MSDNANSAVIEAPSVEEPAVEERTRRKPNPQQAKPKKQPPYAVILHNDHVNSMEFVVSVLRKVLHIGLLQATRMMFQAHLTGRTIVWSGVLEVAELKADQIRSCGGDPQMKAQGAGPLRITVEQLPG